MKKRLLVAVCIATTLSTMGALAFEMPVKPTFPISNPLTSSSSFDKGASVTQINNILSAQALINNTFNNSIANLATILLSKDDLADLKAKKETLSNDIKNKETNAIDAAMVSETVAKLEKATQQANMGAEIKKLSAEQKQLFIDCTYNIMLAGLGYVDIANNSLSLVNQVKANPTAAIALGSDFKALSNVAINIPKQVKLATQVTTGLLKVAKAGGIEIPQPTSKASKPKSIKAADTTQW